MRWPGNADPTLSLEDVLPVKRWNSLSACFYGLVSNIKKEKFFTRVSFFVFFMNNSVQAYMTPTLCQAYITPSTPYLLFIKNRIILQYKVTLLVLKLFSETYIFSAVFVMNCSWRKRYFFIFQKRVSLTRR